MSTPSVFIPSIWSASVLRAFEKASVFGSCLSRAYEGDARMGNTVKVPKIADVAIRDYTMRTPISYDDVSASTVDILIDKQSYFGLKCEDIEKTQASPDFLNAATASAGYGLRNKIDTYTAGILDTGAGIVTDLGTTAAPLSIKAADVVGLFALLSQKLSEANVPQAGRWAVLPPWLLKKLILAKIDRETENSPVLSDGFCGRFMGFNLLVSNNCPVDGSANTSLLAGVADCGTLITQINETETLRDASQFGDLVRGLCVYAAKILQPAVLAKAVVKETAES